MGRRHRFDNVDTRVLSLVGHRASGKTSLADRLLYMAGVTRSPGSVDDGTSLMDHRSEERGRRASIEPSVAWLPWRDHRIELVDLPGGPDTPGRSAALQHGTDSCVVVIDGSHALQVPATRWLSQVCPRLVVVTHVDRMMHPDIHDGLTSAAGCPTPWHNLPFRDEEGTLVGTLDVIRGVATRVADDGTGACSVEPLSRTDAERVAMARSALEEAVALTDDALLERYLEDFGLSEATLLSGLAAAVRLGRLVPALHAMPPLGIGCRAILDAVVQFLPAANQWPGAVDRDGAPVDDAPGFAAQWLCSQSDSEGGVVHHLRVWAGEGATTTWVTEDGTRVRSPKLYDLRGPRRATASGRLVATWDGLPGAPGAVFTDGPRLRMAEPTLPPSLVTRALKTRDGQQPGDVGLAAIARVVERTPGTDLETHPVTGAHLLTGITGAQLQRVLEETGRPLSATRPPVPWLQTIARPALGVVGLYKEVDDLGLPVAFGQCVVDFSPGDLSASTVRVAPGIDPEDLPSRFLPAIERGVLSALVRGREGVPVVGVDVVIQDGRYDMLQSTPEHFERAGADAVAQALQRGGAQLLEPWIRVGLEVDADDVGRLIPIFAGCRGQLTGVDTRQAAMVVSFDLPVGSWPEVLERVERSHIVIRSFVRNEAPPRLSLERHAAR